MSKNKWQHKLDAHTKKKPGKQDSFVYITIPLTYTEDDEEDLAYYRSMANECALEHQMGGTSEFY
jgi:hypothetical protein